MHPSDPTGNPGTPGPSQPTDGGYQLLSPLGRGAFGEVWKARAPGGVEVAIKIIYRHADHQGVQRELEALELIKQLRHPFLLPVQAYWSLPDRLLIALELADRNLRNRLAECLQARVVGIPAAELLGYLREAADALDFLHSHNVQHRDIKPDNILLIGRHAKLADFGLATLLQNRSQVTQYGSGTPAYMPPEIWNGKVSLHSDQYSLAASYVEMRLNHRLFPGREGADLMGAHLCVIPELAPLGPREQAALQRALAKHPEQRFPNCLEFITALEQGVVFDTGGAPVSQVPAGAPLASASHLASSLAGLSLLQPAQRAELPRLLGSFTDARGLARELLGRDWLTPFQVNQLLQGRGQDLVLGQYVLLERLGKGSMGQVFKARQKLLDRVVALKVIHKELLANNPETVRRFCQEMQAAARLDHPNVVRAYDAGEVGGTHFFAMEYVEGTDLGKLVRTNGALPVTEACGYIRQAALGLQHACERGLVHRDIKPDNLMLSTSGTLIKVLDLGLAMLRRPPGSVDSPGLTGDWHLLGTPHYMAPEQTTNARGVDIRADVYSLGCSFYFLLTGRPPFPDGSPLEVLNCHRLVEPAAIERLRPGLTPQVAWVVRRMMAKAPGDRFQTPGEVAEALRPFAPAERSAPVAPAAPTAFPQVKASPRRPELPASGGGPPEYVPGVMEPSNPGESVAVRLEDEPALLPGPGSRAQVAPPAGAPFAAPLPLSSGDTLPGQLLPVSPVTSGPVPLALPAGEPLKPPFRGGQRGTLMEAIRSGPPPLEVGIIPAPAVQERTAPRPPRTRFLWFVLIGVLLLGGSLGGWVLWSHFESGQNGDHHDKKDGEHVARDKDGKNNGGEDKDNDGKNKNGQGQDKDGNNGEQPPPNAAQIRNSIGMKLNRIPAGTFQMGGWLTEAERKRNRLARDEGPQHQVTIPRPFYLGVYEVTQAEYQKVMGKNPSAFTSGGAQEDQVAGRDTSRFPVENVTWEEATEFCRRLSQRPREKAAGRVYRLPTEAEWEYACRGGEKELTPFHFGPTLTFREANFDGRYPFGVSGADDPSPESKKFLNRPCKVGSYKPNRFGLYDMHGNVGEWCSDFYYSYRDPSEPQSPDGKECRVWRGGSWADLGRGCRTTLRQAARADESQWTIGFRVVCTVQAR